MAGIQIARARFSSELPTWQQIREAAERRGGLPVVLVEAQADRAELAFAAFPDGIVSDFAEADTITLMDYSLKSTLLLALLQETLKETGGNPAVPTRPLALPLTRARVLRSIIGIHCAGAAVIVVGLSVLAGGIGVVLWVLLRGTGW